MHKKDITPIHIIITTMAILIIILVVYALINSASTQRTLKSFKSNFDGIDRTITLYDYNGEEIKSWSGKFDVEANDTKVLFDDEDGKRVIIYNGIVVNEEN